MPTLAEKIAIMQAALDGEPIQYRPRNCINWYSSKMSSHLSWDWGVNEYRIAPPKPQPDTFDWSVFPENFKFIAREPDGQAFAYEVKPVKTDSTWAHVEGDTFAITNRHGTPRLTAYTRGNLPWDQSLIERPRS